MMTGDDATPDEAAAAADASADAARSPLPAVPGPRPGPPGAVRSAADARIDDLDERVSAAEALPLDARADAYRALHDELAARLDASPGSP